MASFPGFLFLATEAAKNFSEGQGVQNYLRLASNVYQQLEAGGEGFNVEVVYGCQWELL